MDECPRDEPRAIAGRDMQPFNARRVVMLEFVECREERAKGMTENAMVGFGRCRCGIDSDVMSALVVCDGNRSAVSIAVVGVRQAEGAGAEADEQQEYDAGTPDPRRTAEHRIQLITPVVAARRGAPSRRGCPIPVSLLHRHGRASPRASGSSLRELGESRCRGGDRCVPERETGLE